MNVSVSACGKAAQPAGGGNAIKSEKPDDSFQFLLQMLLQGILNAGNMPLQNTNIPAKNNLPDGEQCLQGVSLAGASNPLASGMGKGGMYLASMVKDFGNSIPESVFPSIKGASDTGDALKDAADIENTGQGVSNSGTVAHTDAVTAKFLDAVKATLATGDVKAAVPEMDGLKADAGKDGWDSSCMNGLQKTEGALDKGSVSKLGIKSLTYKTTLATGDVKAAVPGIDGLKADAGKQVLEDKPAPVQRTAAPQQDSEAQTGGTSRDGWDSSCMNGIQKTEGALDRGGASKLGVKGLTDNMELTSLKSSGDKDEKNSGGKDGPGRKYVNGSVKGDIPFPQNNAVLKSFEVFDGKIMQTVMERQPVQVNKDDILNQVYDRIKLFKGDGSSEMHVDLKPDQLGDVSIKLVMEKGTISARITVENPEVRNIMQDSMPEIKEHLKEQDINVSNLSVYVGTDRSEANGGRDSQGYRWQRPKKLQPNSNVHVSAVQETPYYGGVLNLLA